MLHKVNITGTDETMFIWQTPDGDALLLGTLGECAEIALAITGMVNGAPVPELSEYDEAITPVWSIEEAAAEAIEHGYPGDMARLTKTIRAAAGRGAIRGAAQVDGRWRLPRRTFRHWLMTHQRETRGRPATQNVLSSGTN